METDHRSELQGRERADPLGRAMLAFQRDEPGRLLYRDGSRTQDGRIREFYFQPPEEWRDQTIDLLERLTDREPILDVGCGAGQHALWWQEREVDAVGIDTSPRAVRTARERGLEDAAVMDMFELGVDDRFGAVHCVGTQLGLGGSLAGVETVLESFAHITDDRSVAVVDSYDPTRAEREVFGYRPDLREGLAHRCFHFEFVRDGGKRHERIVGSTLHFLLCSPDRLREAAAETSWQVTLVLREDDASGYYWAMLEQ
ncbi:class I SAM-dependent methyltransferase [Natronobacterium gregoryi]|uniref:Class I SAM-dependent methyltransferase n=2 Tax=Natronobacterium gregoryi TaxID=44930 RepID=L0AIK7_NATGS|nr:class I SAM-dependent methyltransferase [Natronobacterium gregoryi]AFZ72905.1 methylase involved in ubiquinone/menaquinone biosynthesis [Natronobacterium gregoryi SP2]ELY69798.1 methyltransferase type 11 [Natronobacterium gregoryi SP2]PLK21866.1 class I SAM-dependent methyltransferase [Natronobacterium gregoryi SP2]SFI66890.1 Methyltransferase domain-containing protein [Natronobacterium gregoryi]